MERALSRPSQTFAGVLWRPGPGCGFPLSGQVSPLERSDGRVGPRSGHACASACIPVFVLVSACIALMDVCADAHVSMCVCVCMNAQPYLCLCLCFRQLHVKQLFLNVKQIPGLVRERVEGVSLPRNARLS